MRLPTSMRKRTLAGKSVMGLLGDLQVVVIEADGAESQRQRRARSRHTGCRVRPQQRPTTIPNRIISPPIVGVPFLVTMWDCGPSGRIGWPLPCRSRRWSMIQGPNRKTKTPRGDHRAAGPEGNVAKDVEAGDLVGKLDQEIEHGSALGGRRERPREREYWRTSALTIGPIREPSEPLIMIASPGWMAASTCGFERGRSLRIAAPALGGKGLPKRAHERSTTEHEVDAVRRHRRGEVAVQIGAARPELQHVAEHRDAAAARHRSPAWPSSASAARIEAGLAL